MILFLKGKTNKQKKTTTGLCLEAVMLWDDKNTVALFESLMLSTICSVIGQEAVFTPLSYTNCSKDEIGLISLSSSPPSQGSATSEYYLHGLGKTPLPHYTEAKIETLGS